jgi:hypothetical protein
MKKKQERSGGRVAEPVQVYLEPHDQDRLSRLTDRLDATKSDVLRRALEALEREVSDPAGHPALSLIGIGESCSEPSVPDPARDHDAVLADAEERSWEGGRQENGGHGS